jgi:hypothetical protein
MHRDRDLLPWILSGLLIGCLVIAIGAGSIDNITFKTLRVRNLTAEPTPSMPATSFADAPSAAPPVAEPAVLSEPSQFADAPVTTAPSTETNGHIWECTSKGVRTFADSPCGDKSSLRELGPINTMAATPSVRYAPVNAPDPRYMPTYVNESDQDSYSEPAAVDSYDSYPVIQGFAYLPRVRDLHPHRPIHHKPGMPVRRN